MGPIRLQMFDQWHPSLIHRWRVSRFNVLRTRRQREETMLLTVLWLYSDWTLHYINNSAYIHKHWTTQNKHELRTGRVRLLVSCLLNGFMWRCLCVENNRRGMTRCLMTGVTYGDVQGVWLENANEWNEENRHWVRMAYATMFTFTTRAPPLECKRVRSIRSVREKAM